MPDRITTNMAYDKYQGLLAYGTSTKIIKVFSLKGYEFEIYDAHEASLRALTFIPNQGVLVSVDDNNEVAVWDLTDLENEPTRAVIPIEEGMRVAPVTTTLYAPSFLSNEPANHNSVYLALSDGSIYIFDYSTGQFSPLVIKYA